MMEMKKPPTILTRHTGGVGGKYMMFVGHIYLPIIVRTKHIVTMRWSTLVEKEFLVDFLIRDS